MKELTIRMYTLKCPALTETDGKLIVNHMICFWRCGRQYDPQRCNRSRTACETLGEDRQRRT